MELASTESPAGLGYGSSESFAEAPFLGEPQADPGSAARLLFLRAQAMVQTGQRENATPLLQQALKAFEETQDLHGIRDVRALLDQLGSAVITVPVQEEPAREPSLPSYFVPGVARDQETSPDRLGRADDARAIAGLIASISLEPPLAIGLFGPWGSGKTHFMHQISREIGAFTGQSSAQMHRQVKEVTFNAWHYAEHNLWASLLQHVWATLSPQPGWKEEQLTAALASVEGAQRVTEEAKAKASAAQVAVDTARADVEQAADDREKALADAEKLRGADVLDLIDGTQDLLGDGVADAIDELRKAAQVARVDVDLATPKGVVGAITTVRSLATTASSLTITAPWYRSPLVAGAAVLVVLAGAGVLLGQLAHEQSAWFGNAVIGVTQLLAVVGGAVGWVTRRAELVKKLLAPTAALQARVDQRLAAARAANQAKLDLALKRAGVAAVALQQAQAQLVVAQGRQGQAQAEVDGLHGVKLLDRYLADRAGAADYQQYLGIVALAHRDLDNLGRFLLEAAQDEQTSGRIDRIVLYIDDLDRCKPETVARVLEAVHLLLALKLFVVVVGVDRRWLDRSLVASHQALLEHGADTSPRDYLDKIFHLTYTLPPMTDEGAQRLLTGLLPSLDPAPVEQTEANAATSPSPTTSPADIAEVLAALNITTADREALGRVTALLTSSPRRVSRFLSTYLVLRARAVSSALPLRQEEPESVAALAVLVALVFGVPGVAADLLEATSAADEQPLGQWLTHWLKDHSQNEDDPECARVGEFLGRAGPLADLTVSGLWLWWPLAAPYTTFALNPAVVGQTAEDSSPGEASNA